MRVVGEVDAGNYVSIVRGAVASDETVADDFSVADVEVFVVDSRNIQVTCSCGVVVATFRAVEAAVGVQRGACEASVLRNGVCVGSVYVRSGDVDPVSVL